MLISITFLSLIGAKKTDQQTTSVSPAEIGDTVLNFTAKDQYDSLFNLDLVLKNTPIVLVFYRGQWCPYCNKHLSELQDSLELVIQRGATVIAISPEKPEQLMAMEKKSGTTFTLLYDENYKIAKMFGVSFIPDETTVKKYNTFLNADLNSAHENSGTIELPVPATYIINQDHTIRWRHYDPDYKKRASVKDILDNLPIKP